MIVLPVALFATVTLPIGVDVDGVVYREATLGPLTLADALSIDREEASGVPDGLTESDWHGICRTARRIRTLGPLPRSTFRGAWFLELHEQDASALLTASTEVTSREDTFRAAPPQPADRDGAGGQDNGLVSGGAAGAPPS